MNDSVFFDTNIIVYAYSVTEAQKQAIAQTMIKAGESFYQYAGIAGADQYHY